MAGRRLRWAQQWVRHPEDNHQLLAIFFGKLGLEEGAPRRVPVTLQPDGCICEKGAHPWAMQLRADLQ
eukprot:11181905-Lingulodinium_polyedra.AAC.1